MVFGNDVVSARIAKLPRRDQLIDPAMQSQLGDTDNLNGRFLLVSSVPAPCEDGVQEQLAVSAEGVYLPDDCCASAPHLHTPVESEALICQWLPRLRGDIMTNAHDFDCRLLLCGDQQTEPPVDCVPQGGARG